MSVAIRSSNSSNLRGLRPLRRTQSWFNNATVRQRRHRQSACEQVRESRLAVRIYSLAKELKFDSKELVDICAKAGITGKGSALASLADDEVVRLKEYLANRNRPSGTAGNRSGQWSARPIGRPNGRIKRPCSAQTEASPRPAPLAPPLLPPGSVAPAPVAEPSPVAPAVEETIVATAAAVEIAPPPPEPAARPPRRLHRSGRVSKRPPLLEARERAAEQRRRSMSRRRAEAARCSEARRSSLAPMPTVKQPPRTRVERAGAAKARSQAADRRDSRRPQRRHATFGAHPQARRKTRGRPRQGPRSGPGDVAAIARRRAAPSAIANIGPELPQARRRGVHLGAGRARSAPAEAQERGGRKAARTVAERTRNRPSCLAAHRGKSSGWAPTRPRPAKTKAVLQMPATVRTFSEAVGVPAGQGARKAARSWAWELA